MSPLSSFSENGIRAECETAGMATTSTCRHCGAPLTGDARDGFCPKCLFGLAGVGTLSESPPDEEEIGAIIGRYKLLEKVGEGGFGAVYVAEQREPVKRRVALKIIKLGMDTKQVIARFEAERQALALMDHPNIARVLDGGATDGGRPYFVMELVRGRRITDYCDQNNLSTEDRLSLFIQVCHAVQHAHQKGVIHRDIKPSNILVTVVDGQPVPKIIDFGIAKATHGQLTEQTVYTQLHQFIGTPAYMSPEQAQLSGVDVDTRSDVYSLGVLLYELLTGHTPFDAKTLVAAGLDEMRRIIRETEPPRPSTRLSALEAAEQTTVARRRQSEPPKLFHQVRGDLDWIVMKSLEKERARRYETANSLAGDIEHHLRLEPVSAAAPSVLYRFQKFARRNKTALSVASVVAVLLMAGSVVSTWQAVRATRAEANEKAQRLLAEQGRNRALAAEKQAAEQAAIATAVNDFLQNDLLGQAGSRAQAYAGFEPEANLTVRQALERASQRIGDRFTNQPLTESAIRLVIGDALQDVGRHTESLPHLLRAVELCQATLGTDHLETLKCMDHLAAAYADAGDLQRALPLFEKTLKLRQTKLGPDHPDTLMTMFLLGHAYTQAGKLEVAVALLEQALALSRASLGPDHPITFESMTHLAVAYAYAGKPDRSLPLFEEMLKLQRAKLGPDHPDTLVSMHHLVSDYLTAGKLDLALGLGQENLKRLTATFGPDGRHTLACRHNLGVVYLALGEFTRATLLLEEVLKSSRALLGADHPRTLLTMHWLVQTYQQAGRLDQAWSLCQEAVELARSKLGPEHFITLRLAGDLGCGYLQAGNLEQALALHEQTFASAKATLGADHPTTLLALDNLGWDYLEAGKSDQARSAFEEALKLQRLKLGPEHPDTLTTLAALVECRLRQGDYTNAEPLAHECFDLRQKTTPTGWRTFAAQSFLGMALLGQKKYAEAERFLLPACAGLKQVKDRIPARSRASLRQTGEALVQLYEAMGNPNEAARWKRELQ